VKICVKLSLSLSRSPLRKGINRRRFYIASTKSAVNLETREITRPRDHVLSHWQDISIKPCSRESHSQVAGRLGPCEGAGAERALCCCAEALAVGKSKLGVEWQLSSSQREEAEGRVGMRGEERRGEEERL
jgi:hypothetical protein